MKDTQTGVTTLISSDSSGIQGNNGSHNPSIAADGRYVVFESDASNLVTGDTNGKLDVFMKDTQTGVTMLISSDSSGIQGNDGSSLSSLSSDGRYVVFMSAATNLVTGDVNFVEDIFMKDTQTGVTTLISSDSSGIQADSSSSLSSLSSDGRYVVFRSNATNLVTGDVNGMQDIFMKDTQTGVTTLISSDSSGVQGNSDSYEPAIAADGRYVVFMSEATNLVSGDTNGIQDIFMKDTQTGVTTLISSNASGVISNGASYLSSISSDGSYVTFVSLATNLVSNDTNGVDDIFYKRIVP
jgi:hypothetical protein